MEIDTGSLTGAAGGRNARGVCLRLSTTFAARLLAFGFLATFLIGFGIGFACVPAAHRGRNLPRAFATRSSPFAAARGAFRRPLGVPPRRVHAPCAVITTPLRRAAQLQLC